MARTNTQGHELMRRFTSRTRRLLRDKPKYGSLTVKCRGSLADPKRPCSLARTCSIMVPQRIVLCAGNVVVSNHINNTIPTKAEPKELILMDSAKTMVVVEMAGEAAAAEKSESKLRVETNSIKSSSTGRIEDGTT
ncbi:hypothetical protein PIB30_029425 [Stylosanthes scabra]|uniref:Uncharacterized protein n=1 Tax=Stylosanthes scabra TaxID=79078 RepID=A0ABU6XAW0_9FABA|nr:hypothetical protein [Stylosanthes scabra]